MELPKLVLALNISPESFYKGSTVNSVQQAIERIRESRHISVVDVGAKSTRPVSIYSGNEQISPTDELNRYQAFLPAILEEAENLGLKVSVDTQSAMVAQFCLDMGAHIVNDISGLKADQKMARMVAEYGAEVVIMATKKSPGDPKNFEEVMAALNESIHIAESAGVDRNAISIDPGFGGWGGKGSFCDFYILKNFHKLHDFDMPIYVAVSRKSTIQALGGEADPERRLPGTLALTCWLMRKGIQFVRTHDPEETYQALKITQSLLEIEQGHIPTSEHS